MKTRQKRYLWRHKRRALFIAVGACVVGLLTLAATLWLSAIATTLETEMRAANALVPQLKQEMLNHDPASAEHSLAELQAHTASARAAGNDPLWTVARNLPGIGDTFSAASEIATSADDLAQLAIAPLVSVVNTLDWKTLRPVNGTLDLKPLHAAQPKIAAASNALNQSADRLNQIDADSILPQVSKPLSEAREQLESLRDNVEAAADVSSLAPSMLGSDTPRSYLVLIQNNAEARASGGIPGALAVVTLEDGKLALGAQGTAGSVGPMSPPLTVDREQEHIYSVRLGKFMQDINLTPDFPTTADTARTMWEKATGQRVDGVVSLDPIALSYILESTGAIRIGSPEIVRLAADTLPTELDAKNVVPTLLSDVYTKIESPQQQDAYFAAVAQEVFKALSTGGGDPRSFIENIARGASEGRVRVWSATPMEEAKLAKYPVGGSISGPVVSAAEFGVYFNDGTGAKMDYYVKRTVQLIKGCPKDGYEQIAVRVTSTNTAPFDAEASLPSYVTGGGLFGVPPGSVQTNIVVYGPAQANVETATVDDQKTGFAPYLHGNRPVGVLAVRLAPGESQTIELMFGKIVQHTEPNLVVTPTVQDVKDVTLPTKSAICD